jgi:hypothetical protein
VRDTLHRRRVQKLVDAPRVYEEGFDLSSELVVTCARRREKLVAVGCVALERRMTQVLNPSPPLRVVIQRNVPRAA